MPEPIYQLLLNSAMNVKVRECRQKWFSVGGLRHSLLEGNRCPYMSIQGQRCQTHKLRQAVQHIGLLHNVSLEKGRAVLYNCIGKRPP